MTGETEEQIVIPAGWFQRATRGQIVTFLTLLAATVAWGYSVNSDLITLKERLARTEAKLEVIKDDFQKQTLEMRVELAKASTLLDNIDKRLASIDRSVKVMAQ